jgi:hypothetical protein
MVILADVKTLPLTKSVFFELSTKGTDCLVW